MKNRYINVSADADQKQALLFDQWVSGKSIPFADSDGEDAVAAVRLAKEWAQQNKPHGA
jgi:hypothetical protein